MHKKWHPLPFNSTCWAFVEPNQWMQHSGCCASAAVTATAVTASGADLYECSMQLLFCSLQSRRQQGSSSGTNHGHSPRGPRAAGDSRALRDPAHLLPAPTDVMSGSAEPPSGFHTSPTEQSKARNTPTRPHSLCVPHSNGDTVAPRVGLGCWSNEASINLSCTGQGLGIFCALE